jgi:hypothetical protein
MILETACILLTAIALVPAGAHLLELPNKIGMSRDDYLAAQRSYRGWQLLGVPLVAAIVANAALALTADARGAALGGGIGGALLLVTLIVFALVVLPVNRATKNWTQAAADWELLRRRWEYGHAGNAVLSLVALGAVAGGIVAGQG